MQARNPSVSPGRHTAPGVRNPGAEAGRSQRRGAPAALQLFRALVCGGYDGGQEASGRLAAASDGRALTAEGGAKLARTRVLMRGRRKGRGGGVGDSIRVAGP